MNRNLVIGAVGVVVVLGLAYYWYGNKGDSGVAQTPVVPSYPVSVAPPATPAPSAMPAMTVAKTVTVMYTSAGFSPKSVMINKGDTINFVADAGNAMWVASAVHPTHEAYDGTTKNEHCALGYAGTKPLDQCSVGVSFSFTFDKIGIWKYHNHVSRSNTGMVVVQ